MNVKRVILVRPQKEGRWEKAFMFFENIRIIMNRKLVGKVGCYRPFWWRFRWNETRNGIKGDPCYEVAKNLAELFSCSSILKKVECGNESRKWIFPQSLQKGTQHWWHLGGSLVRPAPDFWTTELWVVYGFKPLSLATRLTSGDLQASIPSCMLYGRPHFLVPSEDSPPSFL